jgi:hypothetical protein
MSKRQGEEGSVASKVQIVQHVGPADETTAVLYDITVICGCGKFGRVLLDKSALPDEIDTLLSSCMWDDPKWPINETGRPVDEDPDSIKKKLQVQALIHPHACTKEAWLTGLDFNPGTKAKQGYLSRLDQYQAKSGLAETIAKHTDLLPGRVAFVRQNSVLSRAMIYIFDSWKHEVDFEEGGKN